MLQEEVSECKYIFITFNVSLSSVLSNFKRWHSIFHIYCFSFILKNINTKILNLGCGNSIICEEMYDDGYKSIWNNE